MWLERDKRKTASTRLPVSRWKHRNGGRHRTADLGVMNPEFATAYNAFQSKNQHFQRRNSRFEQNIKHLSAYSATKITASLQQELRVNLAQHLQT